MPAMWVRTREIKDKEKGEQTWKASVFDVDRAERVPEGRVLV